VIWRRVRTVRRKWSYRLSGDHVAVARASSPCFMGKMPMPRLLRSLSSCAVVRLVGLAAVLVVLMCGDVTRAQEELVPALFVSQSATNRDTHEATYGPGTAFETIQPAINAAATGVARLVLVEEATYIEQLTIHADTNVVVRGIGTGGGRPDVTVSWVNAPVVTIEGSGSGVTLDTLNIQGGTAGIEIFGESADGIAAPTIRNCIIRQNDVGIECYEYTAPRILNCMIVENTTDGIVVHSDSSPQLINDTITANGRQGIDLLPVADGVTGTIVNTISWGNAGTDLNGNTDELSISYSDIDHSGFPAPPGDSNGNFKADPLFTADFKLPEPDLGDPLTWSPCIDAGTESGAPTTDFEGEPRGYEGLPGEVRGDGSEYDIGADEWIAIGDLPEYSAYAIPDPTPRRDPGELLFTVTRLTGSGSIGTVEGLSLAGETISVTRVSGGGTTGYYIGVNETPIDASTGDGTAQILVDGQPAGDFLIDTTPPVFLNSAPPSPFGILENNNDAITATLLVGGANLLNHWGEQALPNPPAPAADAVPNDGRNFFFNTGATYTNGVVAGTGDVNLEIDFVVDAADNPGPGADRSAGFGEFWAPSGLPIIRDESSGDHYGPLDLSDPRFVLGPGPEITWVLNFQPAAEGVYRIDIVAEDRAGNRSLPVDLTVYWDKTPPTTQITSHPRARENSTQAGFTWRMGGTPLWPRYSTVLQVFVPEWNVFVPPPAFPNYPGFTPFHETQGTTYGPPQIDSGNVYRFTVLGIDDAGNVETTIGSNNQWTWVVGSPVPDTIITNGPARVTTATTATFTFKEVPEDPTVKFQWKVTPLPGAFGDWQPPDALAQYTHQAAVTVPTSDRAVSYTFQVRAFTEVTAGGVTVKLEDPTPATYTWTVVPPATEGDPGLPPVGETPDPTVLESYGVDVYIDAPGEQPIKYQREQGE